MRMSRDEEESKGKVEGLVYSREKTEGWLRQPVPGLAEPPAELTGGQDWVHPVPLHPHTTLQSSGTAPTVKG